ncbi:hypothetical protein CCR75_001689 [Bremia lactucae]|uniref:Uncharacterized protein n=1 Tax=Bremia lactucae TaxID=4779 RepID=A0A976FE37_BRELC|nr:hypothetical protein CCR75_001689 [Bremia lactucae]
MAIICLNDAVVGVMSEAATSSILQVNLLTAWTLHGTFVAASARKRETPCFSCTSSQGIPPSKSVASKRLVIIRLASVASRSHSLTHINSDSLGLSLSSVLALVTEPEFLASTDPVDGQYSVIVVISFGTSINHADA